MAGPFDYNPARTLGIDAIRRFGGLVELRGTRESADVYAFKSKDERTMGTDGQVVYTQVYLIASDAELVPAEGMFLVVADALPLRIVYVEVVSGRPGEAAVLYKARVDNA